jgi:DNA-binding transcriptional ArsR family regulator
MRTSQSSRLSPGHDPRMSRVRTPPQTDSGGYEMPSAEQVAVAAETLSMLGDPTRLRIVWVLLHDEHSVNDLASIVGARPASVSQHLAKLRLARVVRQRREGNRIFYVAEDTHVRQLIHESLYHGDHAVQALPDHGSSA